MNIIKINRKIVTRIFFFSFFFCFLLIPFLAQADSSWWPLVQCGGPTQDPCALCDLLELAQRVLHFAMQMAFLIVVGFIVYGGFRWIFSLGKEENIREGQKVITNAIIGLIIILSAWLIVNTVFWFITQVGVSGDYYTGTWYNIECGEIDSSVPDSSVPDSSVPDNSVPDSSVPDSSVPDSSVPDSSVPDSSVPDSSIESKCNECGSGVFNVCDKEECESLGGCKYFSYFPFGSSWGFCKPTE